MNGSGARRLIHQWTVRLVNVSTRAALSLALFLWAAPVFAQEPTPFRWTAHEAIPARISDVAVGVNLALDGIHSFRHENHAERWRFVCRTGLTAGVAEVIKRVVSRARPNGADRKSFLSGHTALATTAARYRAPWGASLALTVAWGRQAGGWHYGTDVLAGAGLGWALGEFCDEVLR